MLVILYENSLSRYVLTSVFDHWDTFLITLAVGGICWYWFAVIAFFSSWRAEYALEDQMVPIYIYIYIINITYRHAIPFGNVSEFTWITDSWHFQYGMRLPYL